MARFKHELWVIMKTHKTTTKGFTVVEFITKSFEAKGYIQEKNVLEYTFINYSDVICFVNNFPLLPINIAPGVNTNYKHRFQTNDKEVDNTKYSFYFES